MCLNTPSKIISKKGHKAKIRCAGHEHEVSLELLDNIKVGDYVIVQDGYVTHKINKKEANYILTLIKNVSDYSSSGH